MVHQDTPFIVSARMRTAHPNTIELSRNNRSCLQVLLIVCEDTQANSDLLADSEVYQAEDTCMRFPVEDRKSAEVLIEGD